MMDGIEKFANFRIKINKRKTERMSRVVGWVAVNTKWMIHFSVSPHSILSFNRTLLYRLQTVLFIGYRKQQRSISNNFDTC